MTKTNMRHHAAHPATAVKPNLAVNKKPEVYTAPETPACLKPSIGEQMSPNKWPAPKRDVATPAPNPSLTSNINFDVKMNPNEGANAAALRKPAPPAPKDERAPLGLDAVNSRLNKFLSPDATDDDDDPDAPDEDRLCQKLHLS
jgi:hypothetical protein